MRALADDVKRRAAMFTLGTSKSLSSLVTVPTTATMSLSELAFLRLLATFDKETGGLLILDINNLLRITELNFELVLLAKNLYNLTKRRK